MQFALNERYFQRDKKVMETLAAFPILPSGYIVDINQILAHPGSTVHELSVAIHAFESLWRKVVKLDGVQYAPKFKT